MSAPRPDDAVGAVTAAAVLPLTGRYAFGGRGAAQGLRSWATGTGVRLRIDDCGSDPDVAARMSVSAAAGNDLFFGPYSSGLARAAALALRDGGRVMWNHGATAVPRTGGRVVDVPAPAERYWSGLADALGPGSVPAALLWADSGFGRAVAAGARDALARHGSPLVLDRPFHEGDAAQALADARSAGARLVVGCGRLEDDLALGRALAGGDERVALVACGVAEAGEALGAAVVGWIGPAQWVPGGTPPPFPLPASAGYTAAQAMAAGIVALRALALADSSDPAAVWDAVRGMRTHTFLGPFAIDEMGRQTAATPRLVVWHLDAGRPVMRALSGV